jgi:hypothetical protein
MPIPLLIAGFLVAHAAIHLAFVSPPPPETAGGPAWPFSTDTSWMVTRFGMAPDLARVLASALVAATIGGFALAALTVTGFAPPGVWLPAATIGAAASLAVLVAFFHPWLLLGVAIDIGLLWAVMIAGWTPVSPGPAV